MPSRCVTVTDHSEPILPEICAYGAAKAQEGWGVGGIWAG